MSATELQSELQDRDCPTSEQAKTLLKYDASCGRYLSGLLKQCSIFVTSKKSVNGITHYEFTRPQANQEEQGG